MTMVAPVAKPRCSFLFSGPRPHTMVWFNCQTCWPMQPAIGVCSACIAVCHASHAVVSVGTSAAYCNCGAGPVCQCNR
jgi:hypothetical protein